MGPADAGVSTGMPARPYSIELSTAESTLERFRERRVVVLGDVMIDRYMWGSVTRISPEAPVPIVSVERQSARLGGAANVAANVEALGAQPALVGVVGDDAGARELGRELGDAGISDAWLCIDRARPTTRKTRVVAHNQQVVRADREDDAPVYGGLAADLAERVKAAGKFDGIIFSDYGKGVLTDAALAGDAAAVAAIQEMAGWLGIGIANLVVTLAPEVVVVGGGVSRAGDILLDPARRAFVDHLEGASHREETPIVGATLGANAGLIGAAIAAKETLDE